MCTLLLRLIYLYTDPVDGQDYAQFLDISKNYTGLITDTDDGCSGVIYVSNGLPFGAATQTYVHVGLTSSNAIAYVTIVSISFDSKRASTMSLR